VPRQVATERESNKPGVIGASALVGRSAEMAALTRVFASPPAVVAVEGEAGIGKSRLISEFLASSGAPQRFLLACCPPYREPHTLGAVVDAVRQAALDVTRLPLNGLGGALRSLFPEWAGQLPPPMESAEDATAARHRLFQALMELLRCLDVALLVVEDVHWADEATLEFLLFLTSGRPPPLSVVVTYRAEDLRADSLVRRLLSRFHAGSRGLRLMLRPLDLSETSELVSSMLASEQVSADYAAFVHRHTDGVPLVIEESVRLMCERADLVKRSGAWVRRPLRGIEVPPTVRDVVLERVQRLPPDALVVMQAAAVFAEPMEESVLIAVAGLPADRGRAGLASALDAGLLREDQFGRDSFRHAVAGQAVYEAMPASERRNLHRLAGQALQAASPPPLAQLTRHFRGAGDVANWCRYGEQAADAALASGDEAAAGAILFDLLTSANIPPTVVAEIARKLPLAAFSGTDRYHALISALRKVLTAPGLGREIEADLRFQLGRTLLMIDGYQAGLAELERSIPHLAHDPAAKERALMLLAWRGSLNPNWKRRRWLNRAAAVEIPSLSASERLRLFVDRISTLLTLGEEDGWELASQLPATAGSAAERLQLARAGLNLGALAMAWGRYARASTELAGALDLTERNGYSRLHEAILATQAHLDWFAGAWPGLAERTGVLTANNDLSPITRLEAVLVTGLLEVATGRQDADAGLMLALTSIRQCGVVELWMECAAALAGLHLRKGQPRQALDVTEAVSGVLAHTGAWVWATDLVPARVQALLSLDRAAEAGKLVAAFSRGLAGRTAPAPAAALVLCRAMLSQAGGQHRHAAALFARAAGAWQALPRPYDAALARERQAGCLSAAGQVAAGVAMLSRALDEMSALGATADADRIAHSLRENGVVVPRAWSGGRRGYGDDLSPRELEVVRLVAAGRTNREIAAALYRSVPTIATQVRSAMRKLGAPSRAALAVRAIEAGALDPGDAHREGLAQPVPGAW
jgi:DNA-binding NarL/FixJ family response regulator